jgi:hypothetical protein
MRLAAAGSVGDGWVAGWVGVARVTRSSKRQGLGWEVQEFWTGPELGLVRGLLLSSGSK